MPIVLRPFAVEESDAKPGGYKKVHSANCRDLRDPEVVVAPPNLYALLFALDGYGVADTADELRAALAPCAARIVKDA